jgi:hypothetical protein
VGWGYKPKGWTSSVPPPIILNTNYCPVTPAKLLVES